MRPIHSDGRSALATGPWVHRAIRINCLIHGRRITAVPPSGDQPQSETTGAGASGGASASGARGLANPSTDAARLLADPRGGEVRNAYGFNSDEMAAAAQQVQRSLDGADRFAHAVTYVGGAALGSFAAIELAAGGVMQGALAAEETSVGASQVINVATQIAEGIVADVGGGGVAVPSLVGAGGVGVRMAGQVGDDISRATSRATAVATTGGGGRTLFANQLPGQLTQEMAAAARVGAGAVRPGTPAFERAVNAGTIKWVVTEAGELLISPHSVGGSEISHAVIAGGRPVLAAGQAEIAGSGGAYIGLSITNHSGHYMPSEGSLQVGIDAFAALGIRF